MGLILVYVCMRKLHGLHNTVRNRTTAISYITKNQSSVRYYQAQVGCTGHAHISGLKSKSKVSSCHQVVTPTQWTSTGMPGHYSGTTRPVLANPPGGRASVPQVALCHATGWGCGHPRSDPLARHGQQFYIHFPSLHQVPIDVTAGWAASRVGVVTLEK